MCATDGATIRYTTDGSTPSESVGTIYNGMFTITVNTTVKAIAYKTDCTTSELGVANYTRAGCTANPEISPPDGSTFSPSQEVTIISATQGASIRYTTDGSTPTSTTGTIYSGVFSITSTTTLKAIAYKSGLEDSSVVSATISLQAADIEPKFSPGAGTFTVCPTITITTALSGGTIKFTRDGSDPKTSPTAEVYSSPFTFNGTIRAYAYNGTVTSSTVTAVFRVTGVLKLAKTGQTTSYHAGDDGDLQKGTAWPSPRFTDNGDGTITDNLTGLMWERVPSTSMLPISYSISRIAELNSSGLGGHTDWRFPNIYELSSLINYGKQEQAAWLNSQGFSNIQMNYYWSSSVASGANNLYLIFLREGYIEKDFCHMNIVCAVRGEANGAVRLAKTG